MWGKGESLPVSRKVGGVIYIAGGGRKETLLLLSYMGEEEMEDLRSPAVLCHVLRKTSSILGKVGVLLCHETCPRAAPLLTWREEKGKICGSHLLKGRKGKGEREAVTFRKAA